MPSVTLRNILQHPSPSASRLADQWEVGLLSLLLPGSRRMGTAGCTPRALLSYHVQQGYEDARVEHTAPYSMHNSLTCIPSKHTFFPNSTRLLWTSGGWQKPLSSHRSPNPTELSTTAKEINKIWHWYNYVPSLSHPTGRSVLSSSHSPAREQPWWQCREKKENWRAFLAP